MAVLFEIGHGLIGMGEVNSPQESVVFVIFSVFEIWGLAEHAQVGVNFLVFGYEETTAAGEESIHQ